MYLKYKQVHLTNQTIVQGIPCLWLGQSCKKLYTLFQQTQTKLYTLFRTERTKTIHCLAGHPLIANGTSWLDICMATIWPDVHCLQGKFRGTQREILRKRPKTSYKAWIKLSEVLFKSILGDYWEKFICSSLPARTDGRVLSQQGAPTTCKLTF